MKWKREGLYGNDLHKSIPSQPPHAASDSFTKWVNAARWGQPALIEHEGVRFGGLNGSWKYKPRGHFLYEQGEAESLLATLPPVDILLSHNSPRGIHDRSYTTDRCGDEKATTITVRAAAIHAVETLK